MPLLKPEEKVSELLGKVVKIEGEFKRKEIEFPLRKEPTPLKEIKLKEIKTINIIVISNLEVIR